MAKQQRKNVDIYQEITDSLLEFLEADIVPWRKPWQTGKVVTPMGDWPFNATTGRPYNGVNVLLLWMAGASKGFNENRWLTFNQCRAHGGKVIKGSKGVRITFWKKYKKEEAGEEKERFVLKTFTVFNLEQVEIDHEKLPKLEVPTYADQETTHERAAALLEASGAVIHHGGERAAFSPTLDRIILPPVERFRSEDSYWATAMHELTHWTGHKSRLDRFTGKNGAFGSHDYAREELVAEMGSVFLASKLGIPYIDLEQHASYLHNWITVLKEDKRAIIRAASQARKASEFLLAFLDEAEVSTENAA